MPSALGEDTTPVRTVGRPPTKHHLLEALTRQSWTGNEVIVWGGDDNTQNFVPLNTGGRYNPSTNSWTATSTANAPTPRGGHTAVWTGSEMIVWGGFDGDFVLNTGARYNPATNDWTATTANNAPSPRNAHTTVWTGSLMIIWGGTGESDYLNTGGRYDPDTNSWTATSIPSAPPGR